MRRSPGAPPPARPVGRALGGDRGGDLRQQRGQRLRSIDPAAERALGAHLLAGRERLQQLAVAPATGARRPRARRRRRRARPCAPPPGEPAARRREFRRSAARGSVACRARPRAVYFSRPARQLQRGRASLPASAAYGPDRRIVMSLPPAGSPWLLSLPHAAFRPARRPPVTLCCARFARARGGRPGSDGARRRAAAPGHPASGAAPDRRRRPPRPRPRPRRPQRRAAPAPVRAAARARRRPAAAEPATAAPPAPERPIDRVRPPRPTSAPAPACPAAIGRPTGRVPADADRADRPLSRLDRRGRPGPPPPPRAARPVLPRQQLPGRRAPTACRDTNTRLDGGFTFGFTPHESIELFGAFSTSSNRNAARPSETGPPRPRAHQVVRRSRARRQGGAAGRARLHAPAPSSASGSCRRSPTCRSRRARRRSGSGRWPRSICGRSSNVPLRFHANANFYLDNSVEPLRLQRGRPSTRARWRCSPTGSQPAGCASALGVDAPLEQLTAPVPLRPFAEYHAEIVTASADPAFADVARRPEQPRPAVADARPARAGLPRAHARRRRRHRAALGRVRSTARRCRPTTSSSASRFPFDIDAFTPPGGRHQDRREGGRPRRRGTVVGTVKSERGRQAGRRRHRVVRGPAARARRHRPGRQVPERAAAARARSTST